MAKPKPIRDDDEVGQEILAYLDEYRAAHPGSTTRAYRQNSSAVRVRIVDPGFRGMSFVQRDTEVRKSLNCLSDEALFQLTMLLLMTDDELKKSLANLDFEDPIPSRL